MKEIMGTRQGIDVVNQSKHAIIGEEVVSSGELL